MKINTLTKASKLLADIRLLDEQIIKIDKLAMSTHDKVTKNTLSLVMEKQKEDKAENDTDGYDNIENSLYKSLMSGMYQLNSHNKTTKTESNDFEIDEIETMVICGTLIQLKKDKRKVLVNELLALGYTY